MKINNSIEHIESFLALLRAGLWEKDVQLSKFGNIEFMEVLRLAEEQAVVGLVAAGLERVIDIKLSQEDVLQFVGQALQLEQRNLAMNDFIRVIIEKMQDADISALLVKGQGIAQCYTRPLWRTSGDVDLLLSNENFQKAKALLLPLSSVHKKEEKYSSHLGMNIEPWYVELHGSLRTGLSARVDKEIDKVQIEEFTFSHERLWNNNGTSVFLPSPDNDVFFVFTHFIKHFYKEGMNLRQVCDWCRLLWTYKGKIKKDLMFRRLCDSGLVLEWESFASLAVDYLGMPDDAMPLYDLKYKEEGSRLLVHILNGSSGCVFRDTWSIFKIFPLHTLSFLPAIFFNVNGLKIKERLFG